MCAGCMVVAVRFSFASWIHFANFTLTHFFHLAIRCASNKLVSVPFRFPFMSPGRIVDRKKKWDLIRTNEQTNKKHDEDSPLKQKFNWWYCPFGVPTRWCALCLFISSIWSPFNVFLFSMCHINSSLLLIMMMMMIIKTLFCCFCFGFFLWDQLIIIAKGRSCFFFCFLTYDIVYAIIKYTYTLILLEFDLYSVSERASEVYSMYVNIDFAFCFHFAFVYIVFWFCFVLFCCFFFSFSFNFFSLSLHSFSCVFCFSLLADGLVFFCVSSNELSIFTFFSSLQWTHSWNVIFFLSLFEQCNNTILLLPPLAVVAVSTISQPTKAISIIIEFIRLNIVLRIVSFLSRSPSQFIYCNLQNKCP